MGLLASGWKRLLIQIWTCCFEEYKDVGNDQFHIQGNGERANLGGVRRPQGNNQWNHRIGSVARKLHPDFNNPRIRENPTRLTHAISKYAVGTNGL